MRLRFSSKLAVLFLVLTILATYLTFGAVGHVAFATSFSPSGSQIVALAQQIENGQGASINGWPGSKIIPYVYGGGHNPASPGPNAGLNSGSCENGQTCGVDCSGFTRWVYYLAYGQDVLTSTDTYGQRHLPILKQRSSASSAQPGDLVFFPKHVGIYIGSGLMIDSPNAGGHPPHQVRVDKVNKGFGRVLGYFYIPTATPSPIIVDYGAPGYRYEVVPTGADQGFQDPNYNDSAFQDGMAAFGLALNGCPLDSTIKTNWPSNTDILVRRDIDLPAGTTGLTIHVAIDNDAVVYWNGVQVGSVVHDGCAARDTLIAHVPNSALVVGENVLAIRGTDRGASTYLDLQVLQG